MACIFPSIDIRTCISKGFIFLIDNCCVSGVQRSSCCWPLFECSTASIILLINTRVNLIRKSMGKKLAGSLLHFRLLLLISRLDLNVNKCHFKKWQNSCIDEEPSNGGMYMDIVPLVSPLHSNCMSSVNDLVNLRTGLHGH